LLALGAEAIGQQGEVEPSGGNVAGRLAYAGELIFVDALGIIEQPSDQRALAIVHTARGGKAEELGLCRRKCGLDRGEFRCRLAHQKYPSRFLSSMLPS